MDKVGVFQVRSSFAIAFVATFALAVGGCTVGDPALTSTDAGVATPDAGVFDPGAVHSILAGDFSPLAGVITPVAGRAQMVRMANGTMVDVTLTDLTPNTAYTTHVHALPCAYLGGGHYKMDPSVMDTVETNEIWPAFTTDAEGVGKSMVLARHPARGDAMSIVVHNPNDGAKMACADLLANDLGQFVANGTIAPFADAEAADASITGTADLARDGLETTVTMTLSGLTVGVEYKAHVHALPCGVSNAGGHYKMDPTVDLTEEANELWPIITLVGDGTATATVTALAHGARYDAQSVVLHRVVAIDMAPKVACADLVRPTWPALATTGTSVLLAGGAGRLPQLTATSTMTRDATGSSSVSIQASGLGPNISYTAHVHNLPCAEQSGGGHYKMDAAVDETIQSNEIWVTLAADAQGAATAAAAVTHTARGEAQAVVIHDPADGARLACIDLR